MNHLVHPFRQKGVYVSILLLGIAFLVLLRNLPSKTQPFNSDDTWLDVLFVSALKSRDQVTKGSDTYREVCPKKVWFAEDLGRMGNKFLEFMNARVVATFQNRELSVTDEFYTLFGRYFTGLRAAIVDKEYMLSHCNMTAEKWKWTYIEYFQDSDHLLFPLEFPYMKFIGYPLNITSITWSIMFRHRETLLQEFKFKDDFMAKVKLRIGEVTKGLTYSTLVGIHVRRTDFYVHMVQLYGQAKTAGPDFFERAKAIYKQRYRNLLFMVISDDLAWCKENLQAPDVVFPGHGNQDDPGWDLAILASCDHLILTYGTYGVMAAYFNGGDVVIADNFTGRPNELNERLRLSNLTNWTWLPV